LAATAAAENPAKEVLANPAGKFIKFAGEKVSIEDFLSSEEEK
jgi:hypothetical protein